MARDFLQQVADGFDSCGLSCKEALAPGRVVGLGVSGGADSMALLHSVLLLRQEFWGAGGAELLVVSVNHNIRPPEESGGDAAFVEEFCAQFSGLRCVVVEVEPGRVESEAKIRGRGVEEAARFLRYEKFLREAEKYGCSLFCLAHNRNDQLETLLLRFLQGSGEAAAAGIPSVRDIFVRPLLNVSRADIEEFLAEQEISFRTDESNRDNKYLRNRCRNLLIPLLDKEFGGWDGAVLGGAEKRRQDDDFVASLMPVDFWKLRKDGGVSAPWNSFFALHPALRRRVLFGGLNLAGAAHRIPFHLLQALVTLTEPPRSGRIFSSGGIEARRDGDELVVARIPPWPEEEHFSLTVDAPGAYRLLGCVVEIGAEETAESFRGAAKLLLGGVAFSAPFVFRSLEPGDKVLHHGKILGAAEALVKRRSEGDSSPAGVVEEVGRAAVTLLTLRDICPQALSVSGCFGG